MSKAIKKTRRFDCVLLALGVVLMGFFGTGSSCGNKKEKPVASPAAVLAKTSSSVTRGECGESITWEYDSKTKTLTITGSGEMKTKEQFPWSDIKIKKVVFDGNITSICKNCFYSHHELSGPLLLPKSLRKIEEFAFYGCDGLTGDLLLPEGLEVIGDYAFTNCGSLDGKLLLPKTLKSIGREAFSKCGKLSGELVLPDGLETIGQSAFFECKSFTGSLVLPD